MYIAIIIFLFLILFLLFFPFKFIIENKNEYLDINFSYLFIYRLNLIVLLDKIDDEKSKKEQGRVQELIKASEIKYLELNASGLNFDYQLNSQTYGLSLAVFSILKTYLKTKEIDFNYHLNYLGEKRIKFKSILNVKLITIIKESIKARRKKKDERTSN